MPRPRKSDGPFRYFDSSPEVIRLVVMMYVRFLLSLRNVEGLLFERGIDICHETVRMTKASDDPETRIEIEGRTIKADVPAGALDVFKTMIPLGRAGSPEEAAGAVYLLCHPESDYISGQVLLQDGVDSPRQLLSEFAEGNILALQNLNHAINAQSLDQATTLLASAGTVFVVGVRRSFPVAVYLTA